MTTIAVVRKNGYAAIAADTLTKWGSGKESAAYIRLNPDAPRRFNSACSNGRNFADQHAGSWDNLGF